MGAVAQPLYKQIAPCGPCLAGRRASHAGSFPGREALPWPVHGSCDREHPRVLETRHSMSWQPAGTTATHRMGDLGAVIAFTLYTQMCCPLPPAGGMLGGVGCEGTRGASRAETVIAESPPRANTKTPDSALCPQLVTCGQHVTAAQALQRTPGCRPLLGQ